MDMDIGSSMVLLGLLWFVGAGLTILIAAFKNLFGANLPLITWETVLLAGLGLLLMIIGDAIDR